MPRAERRAERFASIRRIAKAPEERVPALALPLIAIGIFAGFCFLRRIYTHPALILSFGLFAAALMVFLLVLRTSTRGARRTLTYEFIPIKVHYVQFTVHSCIYAYWGWYWPEVYRHIPLILGQVAFAYALDMLVTWSRRDRFVLGFGPVPIILSTNLFLWFRDDWFWLQFLMIATGVLCKEFVKWDCNGVRRHIFNPSAIALFLFSIGLILTGSTAITWGPEMARSLHLPPYIYPEIFVIGIVVQGLFSVTMVTLAAATTLCVLNVLFTQATGTYQFVDSNVPVSVFIGLHLLVTDPATSPRHVTGKFIFGALYGAGVFALFSILGYFRAPQFYDKLLCVPLLNLSVRGLDRFSEKLSGQFLAPSWFSALSPKKRNFGYMGIWASLFSLMMLTGFVGHTHPGQSIAFWEKACRQSRYNGCSTWVHALQTDCQNNRAPSCLEYGKELNEGRVVAASKLEGGEALGRACDLGLYPGCFELNTFLKNGGISLFSVACDRGDNTACFLLGRAFLQGLGVPQNGALAATLLEKGCGNGFSRACSALGQTYLTGRAGLPNPLKSLAAFEQACRSGDAPACYSAGMLYVSSKGTQQDATIAQERFGRACKLGMKKACNILDEVAAQLRRGRRAIN